MDGYPEGLTLSPAEIAADGSPSGPGALQHFLPQGFGLGPPAIVTPYGAAGGDYYGFDKMQVHPIQDAPSTESNGGTLYFDAWADKAALATTLTLMGVRNNKDYVAFAASSPDPREDRYLDQLRLVSRGAIGAFYRDKDDKAFPDQTLDCLDAILAFVEAQKTKFEDESLDGLGGGDGDWARERLAFGFHMENTYWGVYRVWSRVWLITK